MTAFYKYTYCFYCEDETETIAGACAICGNDKEEDQ